MARRCSHRTPFQNVTGQNLDSPAVLDAATANRALEGFLSERLGARG